VRWVGPNLTNRKEGRRTGLNKQSIKKERRERSAQQEIIIWAVVHFV
jgi:hypothetical protein